MLHSHLEHPKLICRFLHISFILQQPWYLLYSYFVRQQVLNLTLIYLVVKRRHVGQLSLKLVNRPLHLRQVWFQIQLLLHFAPISKQRQLPLHLSQRSALRLHHVAQCFQCQLNDILHLPPFVMSVQHILNYYWRVRVYHVVISTLWIIVMRKLSVLSWTCALSRAFATHI